MNINEFLRKYHKENIEVEFQEFEDYENLVVTEGLGAEKVLKYISEKIKVCPSNPFYYYHAFEYFVWNKNFEKAFEFLDKLKSQFPSVEGINDLKEIIVKDKTNLLKKKLEKWHTNLFSILAED